MVSFLWTVVFQGSGKLQSQHVCSPEPRSAFELNSLFLPKLIGKDFIHV